MAKLVSNQKGLRSLKIDGLGMMDSSIDQAWADALTQNLTIKAFKLKNSMSAYGLGEKMFKALKRRPSRLESFVIKDCPLVDQDFYYFTAFVRSHQLLKQFKMSGNCFSSINNK